MVFSAPPWTSDITTQIPPTGSVGEFMLAARRASGSTRPAVICAVTGKKYTLEDITDKVDILARALCNDLGWTPNQGAAEDKVVGILSGNTPYFVTISWAIHRIGGTCLLLQPTTTAAELGSHMTKARCKVLFVSETLLPTCEHVFHHLLELPQKLYVVDHNGPHFPVHNYPGEMKSLQDLFQEGSGLPEIEKLEPRDAFRELAYLLTTSGTSGLQKLARITHANMMANVLQPVVFETEARGDWPRIGLGVLPLNHGYGLVTSHIMFHRGDTTVLHPSFNMQLVLKSIQEHRIERLYLIPPVVAALAANPVLFQMYDLSSIQEIVLGAAACSESVTKKIAELQPKWKLLVGYGLTELVSIATFTSPIDIMPGSSGTLLPSVQARLVDSDGVDITEYDVPGELHLKAPNRIPGYVEEDESANANFVTDGWLATGDIALFRLGAKGDPHLFLVDRLKDMIKVKGNQVNPGEIEEVLRRQPGVADAAVIGTQDDVTGERPLAFVVATNQSLTDKELAEFLIVLDESVKSELHELCWLRRQIRFVESLPRSQSGKVLKKVLRAKAAEST